MVEILQEQGRIQDFETRFRMKSGEIRDVLVSAEVIEVAGSSISWALLMTSPSASGRRKH